MQPTWRKTQKTLHAISKAISILHHHAKSIDRSINSYEQVRSQNDKAARMLSSSSLTQFAFAGFVLFIAFGAVFINFNLIALPMSQMVGEASYIGPYQTPHVAALVIILIELTMGLFLMELLRITRLFPVLGSIDDKLRHRLIWLIVGLLAVLAGVESALAFMRDRIIQGVGPDAEVSRMIPILGQMILGFILPFALTFVAIPLESFISSSRTVLGMISAAGLRFFAFVLRLIGNTGYYTGRLVVNLYDLVIFPAIWLENVILGSKVKEPTTPNEDIYENSTITDEAIDHLNEATDYKEHQE